MRIPLLILSTIIFAQLNSFCANRKDPGKWFSCKNVNENVLMITDRANVNMFVVIGKDSALLIDTGHGVEDLKEYVSSIVKLPLIVVDTHGHDDHSGGNDQFERVYAHPDDFDLIKRAISPEERDGLLKYLRSLLPANEPMPYIPEATKRAELIPIREGFVFDLGGRKVEVIEVPGHTSGSICLLDHSSGILFTGDNCNGQTWLHLHVSTPLETYAESQKKLINRKNEYTLLLPGHGEPFDKEFLEEISTCAENILSDNCKGKDIETFAGSGKSCVYKRANIIFNPDNLYEKK